VRILVAVGLGFFTLTMGVGMVTSAVRTSNPSIGGGLLSTTAVFIVAMLLLWAWVEIRWRQREQVRWFLTDGGLQSILPAGDAENIPWESIHGMVKRRFGLTIQWKKAKPHPKEIFFIEHSDFLYIGENEALRLLRAWQSLRQRG